MADPILWQFKYSHYNEKARWALDRAVLSALILGPAVAPVLLRRAGAVAAPRS